MISIIICSRNIILFDKLKESIENTIGEVVYEIIKLDNLTINESITKVYNRGLAIAKYELLLFVHEDVVFHTSNWGNILSTIFNQNLNIGLLGIAGTKYKSKYPSAFWHTKIDNLFIHVLQHYKSRKPQVDKLGFKEKKLEKVVAIDGVFLALRKSINVKFNEKIKGFHCYDLGLSVDVIESNYDVMVTDQILIEHFSIGNTNLDFVKGVLEFHFLYKNKLSTFLGNKEYDLDTLALERFLGVCYENRFIPFKLWMIYFFRRPFHRLNLNLFKLVAYKIRK
ncbi:glycosyltransferase [uncultured Flavobacterium sp.]|uniref:glycosyltransferase n=1 Tax=uncultured Flavobacterium sp. TaxID=165435 RepID=UPI0030EEF221|tara:strand:- start:275 stop:1117 length:843 start_codon:yes stop_codon:yes gene_type:complete